MKVVKPKALKRNGTIGLIAPASPVADSTRIEKAVNYLERLGYRVKIGKNVGKSYGYLAGSDKERVDDIHSMFSSKSVDAIICLRGGYGTPRLLKDIDYKLIAHNPKIFVGYSDITALQMAFLNITGLVTYSGPMAAVDFRGDVDPYTEENFWETITNANKLEREVFTQGEPMKFFGKKLVAGRLIGGNLALFCSSLGTPFLPKAKNKILFFEDVGEPPYRIDRLFTQLKNADYLSEARGMLLGAFTDTDEENRQPTLSSEEVFANVLKELKIPVVKNFPNGHITKLMTLPFGLKVEIDPLEGKVFFKEPAVI